MQDLQILNFSGNPPRLNVGVSSFVVTAIGVRYYFFRSWFIVFLVGVTLLAKGLGFDAVHHRSFKFQPHYFLQHVNRLIRSPSNLLSGSSLCP